jgi:hypothetical protein
MNMNSNNNGGNSNSNRKYLTSTGMLLKQLAANEDTGGPNYLMGQASAPLLPVPPGMAHFGPQQSHFSSFQSSGMSSQMGHHHSYLGGQQMQPGRFMNQQPIYPGN